MVFFFDAINGKLLAIREPQLAAFGFHLYATSEGRFLLHLRNVSDLGAKQVDSLILMSPDGKTLKSLELQPAEGDLHPRVWKTFISPSRKTLLATQVISHTTHYKVFETDTVAMRAEWVSPDPAEPIALSVSDKEILGLPHPTESGRPASGPQQDPQVSIRMFDGAWRSLLPPSNENLRRSFYAFLSDDAITVLDNGYLQGDSFAWVRILQTSGQTEGPKVVKKSSWNNIWAGARIETSIDGHYFAATVSSTSRFWEALDFDPSHTELYVWHRSDLAPILRIKVTGSRLSFSFLPDGSRVVVLDGKTLKAYSAP
jgi:hypothetical protein